MAGIVIGLPVTIASARVVAWRLFGVGPADPLTIVAATLVLLGVATLAGLLPARRASRVNPLEALRCE